MSDVLALAAACIEEYRRAALGCTEHTLRNLPKVALAAGKPEWSVEALTSFAYHYERLRVCGPSDVIEVSKDFWALTQALEGHDGDLRERLRQWRRFHDHHAHLLARPLAEGASPEAKADDLCEHADSWAKDTDPYEQGQKWLRTRGIRSRWWWHECHPKKAEPTLVRTLQGHKNRVTAIVQHPDGRRVVSASADDRLVEVPLIERESWLDEVRATVEWSADGLFVRYVAEPDPRATPVGPREKRVRRDDDRHEWVLDMDGNLLGPTELRDLGGLRWLPPQEISRDGCFRLERAPGEPRIEEVKR